MRRSDLLLLVAFLSTMGFAFWDEVHSPAGEPCGAEITPGRLTAGREPVELVVGLSQPIAVERILAPADSGIAVDGYRVDGPQRLRVILRTEAARAGTWSLTFAGAADRCRGEVEVATGG